MPSCAAVATCSYLRLKTITLKSLDILKKGLSKFMKMIQAHMDELNTKLAQKESISLSDEYWLPVGQ